MPYRSPQLAQAFCKLAIAFACLGIAWALANSPPVLGQAAEMEVSLSEYRDIVKQAIDELAWTGSQPPGRTNTLSTINAIRQVRLPDGSRVSVLPLIPKTDNKQVVIARLQGMLLQIEAATEDNTSDRLAVLESILARPEFQTQAPLWQRLWRWLRDLLSQLPLPQINVGQGTLSPQVGTAVAYAIAAVAGTLLVALLAYWFRGLIRGFARGAQEHTAAMGHDGAPVSAAEAAQFAEEAAAAGDFRDAVRQLYLAALLTLDEREVITYAPDATNREVLNQLSASSLVRAHLQPMTELFDQVWYGVREPDAPTFHAYRQDVRSLQEVVQNDTSSRAESRAVAAL